MAMNEMANGGGPADTVNDARVDWRQMTDAQIAEVMVADKKYRKGNGYVALAMFGWILLVVVGGVTIGPIVIPIAFAAMVALIIAAVARAKGHAPLLASLDAALSAITEPVVAEFFGPDAVHERQRSIDKSVLVASAFFKRINFDYSFVGGDMVSGTRNGTRFVFSDARLYTSTKDHTITYFKGQWLICETARALTGQVRVAERKKRRLNEKDVDNHAIPGVPVDMQNTAFNEKYLVMADDPAEAFLVLTPQFMEHIIAMDEEADARTFFWFEGRNAHCGMFNYRNLFSLSNYMNEEQPTVEGVAKIRERFRSEAKWIAEVIDEFLKNKSLFPE
jgi:hypothetical protein